MKVLTEAPVLVFSDWSHMLEVTCVANIHGIGAVISHNHHLIEFFSEKLKRAQANYSAYDEELDAVVTILHHWKQYLCHQEFLLHSDHEALKILKSHDKKSAREVKISNVLELFFG